MRANVTLTIAGDRSGLSEVLYCQVDCDYVVSSSDPVFARLEHHKSHEYSSRRTPGAGALRRRRGRPPKSVVEYEFSEDEIRARAAIDGPASAIAHGFVRYTVADQCPDRHCVHRQRDEHFHCVRARCHDVELYPASIVAHDRDFHAHVQIAAGFEFFGADVDCRRTKCRARRGSSGPTGLRHFHCVRSRCDYVFVRQSTMAQHEAKHRMLDERTSMTGVMVSSSSSPMTSSRLPVPIIPRPTATVSLLPPPSYTSAVLGGTLLSGARSGQSLPTQIVSANFAGAVPSVLFAGLSTAAGTVAAPSTSMVTTTTVPCSVAVQGFVSSVAPSSVIVVAADGKFQSSRSQPSSLLMTSTPAAVASSKVLLPAQNHHDGSGDTCCRASCQLKRRDHFHCIQCDHAFSDALQFLEHSSRAHGVTPTAAGVRCTSMNLESTSLSNNTSKCSTLLSSSASGAAVDHPASVCQQPATVKAENTDVLRGSRADGNGGELAIDLSSCGQGRS